MKVLKRETNSERVVVSSTSSVTNEPMIAGTNRTLRTRRTTRGPIESTTRTETIIAVPSTERPPVAR